MWITLLLCAIAMFAVACLLLWTSEKSFEEDPYSTVGPMFMYFGILSIIPSGFLLCAAASYMFQGFK